MELKYCHVIQTKEKSDLKLSSQLNSLMLMPTEINTNLWPMDTNAMRGTEKPIQHVSYLFDIQNIFISGKNEI